MNEKLRTFRLLALAGAALLLVACKKGDWPEGMAPIHWDRDTCAQCAMVISDPRFAAELRGGPSNTAFKFDDIGCLSVWLREKSAAHPWAQAPETRIWVAGFDSPGRDAILWLDARMAHYIERSSPMGFNFAAVAQPSEKAARFDEVQQDAWARQERHRSMRAFPSRHGGAQ